MLGAAPGLHPAAEQGRHVHAVTIVLDEDRTLARGHDVGEGHVDAGRVGVIGVLHQLHHGDDLVADQLAADQAQEAGARLEGDNLSVVGRHYRILLMHALKLRAIASPSTGGTAFPS
jgi:hypothetical protein